LFLQRKITTIYEYLAIAAVPFRAFPCANAAFILVGSRFNGLLVYFENGGKKLYQFISQ
jgi:hypothetical protein